MAVLILGALGWGLGLIWWPLSIPFLVVWLWVVSFFRDPPRRRYFSLGDLCSPADGTVTEITHLDQHEAFGGPSVRIGIFLSLFNVHVNRMPCAGKVRSAAYKKGEFLDARHAESGQRNESNALIIDPEPPLPGPVVVRQVAGLVARRIVCHVKPGDSLGMAARIGLIKFGSRTELIVPRLESTEVLVKVGDRVYGGLTVLVQQKGGR